MDGEGGEAIGRVRLETAGFDLPSVLAQLDRDDCDEQRAAVATLRETLAENPTACLPAVPKLRRLLEQPDLDFHEEVAYCLAELATESIADVAPSTDVIVGFVADNATAPATGELLRCLETIAGDRPAVVADHAATIATVIDRRSGYHTAGIRLFQALSAEDPSVIEPAVPVLADALAADPETHGVAVLSSIGRLARSTDDLPSLEFVEPALGLVDHGHMPLRRNAVGCLADVARRRPEAIEPCIPDLAAALEYDDSETRANAAIAVARVAAQRSTSLESVREPLLAVLADEHERARANACAALGHGEVESAADRLTTLAHEDPNPDVRERASWALDRVSSR